MYSSQPSYWEETTFLANIDIAVLGAGLVGTTAAIYAKKKYPKAKVVVFDRGFISSGASTKNAGFACFGSISEVLEDLDDNTESEVFGLLARRYQGLNHLLELLGEENLDYKPYGGFEIFRKKELGLAQECTDKIAYFNKQVSAITGMEDTYSLAPNKITESGFGDINTCIANHAEGQLNPGKMMQNLYQHAQSLGVIFFHGIEILDFEDSTDSVQLQLANGWLVKANQLIIANNGFAKKLIPDLALKTVRNQVMVTSLIKDLPIKGTFHMHKGYFYFRNIGSRILIGGGRHLDPEVETTDAFGSNTLIKEAILSLLDEIVLPKRAYTIDSQWSGILGVGTSKQPILKKHSEHVTLAVRLGGMGVALGSLLGKDAVDYI